MPGVWGGGASYEHPPGGDATPGDATPHAREAELLHRPNLVNTQILFLPRVTRADRFREPGEKAALPEVPAACRNLLAGC